MRNTAAQDEHVGARRLADDFEAVAIRFDIGFVGVFVNGIADVIVLEPFVHVLLPGGGAGPEAVHLEVTKVPIVGDAADVVAQVREHVGVG